MPEIALRVAAVEDDPRFRASLSALLQTLSGIRLIAVYPAAEPLLSAAERAHRRGDDAPWDIVLMDLGLPGKSGNEATQLLKSWFPNLHVVALTVFEDPQTVLEAICSGIDGYILKEAGPDQILEQLQLVARNGATISPRLAGTVLKLIRISGGREQRAKVPQKLGLTDRQIDVLRALADGRSYRETGEALGLSVDTVRSHIRHTYAALQVRSAAQAVSQALSRGLL
jgi:DNA-binding NarL/FixJ family response regulator